MMVSMETKMTDMPEPLDAQPAGNVTRSIALIAAAAVATIFSAGAIVGVITSATEGGHAL